MDIPEDMVSLQKYCATLGRIALQIFLRMRETTPHCPEQFFFAIHFQLVRAVTWVRGFVNNFARVPLACLDSTEAAEQLHCQKTFYITSYPSKGLSQYHCCFSGHKMNHSFEPNCIEWFMDHPRYNANPDHFHSRIWHSPYMDCECLCCN